MSSSSGSRGSRGSRGSGGNTSKNTSSKEPITSDQGLKPSRPTHFFAVRINSPQMINDMVEWQQSVLSEHDSHSEDYDLRDYLIEKERMHFTLFVLTLNNQDELNDCIRVFKSCASDLKKIVKDNLDGQSKNFSFKLSGVHTFEDKKSSKGRVVFTGPDFSHTNGRQTFLDISQHINTQLKQAGLTVDRINNEIHCTLAKTTKVRKQTSPRAFPEYVYSHKKDTIFGGSSKDASSGGETITEVLLCRMKQPFSSDGFYHVEEVVTITEK